MGMRIERIERRDDGRIGQMIGEFFFDGDAEKGKEYYRAFRTVRDKSVKLVDDGEIAGIMLTADDGIELFNGGKEPDVNTVLHKYSGIMASVLGLEPEYRGKGLSDKLVYAMLSLCSSYDYILVPVSKKLNTHTFWARYGAVKVCDDGNNLHYILTKNKSLLSELGTSRLSEDKVHGIVKFVMCKLL